MRLAAVTQPCDMQMCFPLTFITSRVANEELLSDLDSALYSSAIGIRPVYIRVR